MKVIDIIIVIYETCLYLLNLSKSYLSYHIWCTVGQIHTAVYLYQNITLANNHGYICVHSAIILIVRALYNAFISTVIYICVYIYI